MSTDRIAAYYAKGGGQGGHDVKSRGMHQSNGLFPMTEGWKRYNDPADLIWITDLYGRDRWLTRGQVRLYQLLLTLIDNGTVKMREIAEKLGIAASTVSRGMAKLMSYGLIAYVSAKGRYGGTIILRRTSVVDGFERFARKARERVRRWYQTAQARLLRAHSNVASYVILEERVSSEGTGVPDTHNPVIGRNIRKWTPEELRSEGII